MEFLIALLLALLALTFFTKTEKARVVDSDDVEELSEQPNAVLVVSERPDLKTEDHLQQPIQIEGSVGDILYTLDKGRDGAQIETLVIDITGKERFVIRIQDGEIYSMQSVSEPPHLHPHVSADDFNRVDRLIRWVRENSKDPLLRSC